MMVTPQLSEIAGTYGVPRITAELHDTGHRVNHKRVARVMRGIGLAGLRLRRRHRTTLANPAAAKALDQLGRDFTAQEPNTRYVGDITSLPIADGTFLYLATVMDLCSRRLAGWAVADHMRVDLVIDALHAAEQTTGQSGRGRSSTATTGRNTVPGPSPTLAAPPE
jgi:transposase InsO family protein